MSATFDPKHYLADFVLEAQEHLATFEALLAQAERHALEGRPLDEGMVHRLFRAVHTLKGMAGMLGFSAMVTLAHEIEELLAQVRSGQRRLVLPEIIALADVAEVLAQLLDRVATTGKEEGVDVLPSQATLLALARGELAQLAPLDLLEKLDPHDQVAHLVEVAKGAGLYNVRLTAGLPAGLPGQVLGAWDGRGRAEAGAASPEAPLDVLLLVPAGTEQATLLGLPGVQEVADAPLPWGAPAPVALPRPLEATRRVLAVAPPSPPPAVRVEASRLDRLSALVAALVADHARLAGTCADVVDLPGGQAPAEALRDAVAAADDHTAALARELAVARRVAAGALFGRFTRPARELARATGKIVRLETLGVELAIDRDVAEGLLEPLMHLVRNAIDHGIESPGQRTAAGKGAQGVVTLSASVEGDALVIAVSDDGQGIDRPAVLARAREAGLVGPQEQPSEAQIDRLIFHPGLTTAAVVTDVSGRGVGMDAVRASLARLDGRIEVSSYPGKGTRCALVIPKAGEHAEAPALDWQVPA